MSNLSSIINSGEDPTLLAVDAAIMAKSMREEPERPYLGMSAVGHKCKRHLWYGFRFATIRLRPAFLIKCAQRGHLAEDVQAQRLRLVDGITLNTVDPYSQKQFEFQDIDGHFKGHCDGDITGILQAPKTTHIWEHKEKEEKFVTVLEAAKLKFGEKKALQQWNPEYYAQALLYMFYKKLTRHYMTVTVPGGRRTISVRTNSNNTEARALIDKAKSIITAQNPPEKISHDPTWFECKMCSDFEVCHKDRMPEVNCRTCLHSTPVAKGEWHCAKFNELLPLDKQRIGCGSHLYIPGLIPGTPEEVGENFIRYKLKNGNEYINRERETHE